jgi:dihydrofolate synthase/folylpolyglutamate synthase
MFHRVGKAAYKANLDNAQALDKLCNFPHRKYRTIHVAGTNGKGSVSHILASVFQKAGYKTGLFTSPHLIDFRERIRVNGQMITEKAVVDFVSKYKHQFEELKPSFFEMTSAMALDYFAEQNVDIAIIETGLGGRLDSTNIIKPVLSVITNIGYDHTDLLGDTLEKIAWEKAGIIKQGVLVVIGESHSETKHVFERIALENKSEIRFADSLYSAITVECNDPGMQKLLVKKGNLGSEVYHLDLQGIYQQKNICTVLAVVDALNEAGYNLSGSLADGLRYASQSTGLLGRWQIMGVKPLMICDTGHNKDGISWVVKQIKQVKYNKLHFILGVMKDKDVSNILPLLPADATYYFTKASIPRALDEKELMEKALSAGLKGMSYSLVAEAIGNAKKKSGDNDLIFIGGSTFIVAEALIAERKF